MEEGGPAGGIERNQSSERGAQTLRSQRQVDQAAGSPGKWIRRLPKVSPGSPGSGVGTISKLVACSRKCVRATASRECVLILAFIGWSVMGS